MSVPSLGMLHYHPRDSTFNFIQRRRSSSGEERAVVCGLSRVTTTHCTDDTCTRSTHFPSLPPASLNFTSIGNCLDHDFKPGDTQCKMAF